MLICIMCCAMSDGHCKVKLWLTKQQVNKQFLLHERSSVSPPIEKGLCGTARGQKVQDRHPTLTHPSASTINSAVITNNGICQRSVSYLNG